MCQMYRVTLEIEGMDELMQLLEKADEQVDLIKATIDQINVARLRLQAKINQPTAGTGG